MANLKGSLNEVDGTLKGSLSSTGTLGANLANGVLRGYSAYEIAVMHGFEGTEEEWLDSLVTSASDYEVLDNKPQINSIELVGDKTLSQLGLQEEIDIITNADILATFKKVGLL